MLDAKFVDAVADLTRKATLPVTIDTPDPREKFFRQPDGSYQIGSVPRAAKSTRTMTIESLAAHVVDNSSNGKAAIYYSRKGIFGYVDEIRFDKTRMLFDVHPGWAWLEEQSNRPAEYKQGDIHHTIKTVLRNCYETQLLTGISRVNWELTDKGKSEITQTGRSMSRDTVSKLAGMDALPEETSFTVAPFLQLPAARVKISCYIKPIPERQAFIIAPYAGEIENGYQLVEEEISRRIIVALNGAAIPIYNGYPMKAEAE